KAVKHAWLGELASGAAVGAGDFRQTAFRCAPFFLFKFFEQMIFPITTVAGDTFNKGVDKGLQVPGCLPYLRWQNNRGVQTDDVITGIDHITPPLTLDVFLQFHTQWAIIPGRTGSSIDFTAREDKATALCQGNYAVETTDFSHRTLL